MNLDPVTGAMESFTKRGAGTIGDRTVFTNKDLVLV